MDRPKITIGEIILICGIIFLMCCLFFMIAFDPTKKTLDECYEANSNLNSYINDIASGKVQATWNYEGWEDRNYKLNISMGAPNGSN